MSVEEFQAPASLVVVDGNVVGDELMDESLWATSLALARKLPPTIQNTFDPNVANCCEDGTTNGWQVLLNWSSNTVLSASTDWAAQGTHSLKIEFKGNEQYEGVITSTPCTVQAGKENTLRLTIKGGNVGIGITIDLFDTPVSAPNRQLLVEKKYILSGGNDTITIPYTAPAGVTTGYLEIVHSAIGPCYCFVDEIINAPGNFPNLLPGDAQSPNWLGWCGSNSNVTSKITTEQAYNGTNSLKAVYSSAGGGLFHESLLIPLGTTQITGVAIVKGQAGTSLPLGFEQYDDINNIGLGGTEGNPVALDGTWQIIPVTATLNSATTRIVPTLYKTSQDTNPFYVGAASFHPGSEQKLEPSLVWSEGKGAITNYPSGDACILCRTIGSRANEGVNMYGFSQYERMTAIIANQRVWHSVYLQGSGIVKLYVYEFNVNGAIVNSAITDTITLSEAWQRVDKDLTVTVNGYVCFGVETATTQSAQIRINDVYINVGDSARSGANLAPNDIKGTGADGTTGGFAQLIGNEFISVDFDCDAIEATYSP